MHLHPELCVQLQPQQLVWRSRLEEIELYWVHSSRDWDRRATLEKKQHHKSWNSLCDYGYAVRQQESTKGSTHEMNAHYEMKGCSNHLLSLQ